MIRYNYGVMRANSLEELINMFYERYGIMSEEFKGARIIYLEKSLVEQKQFRTKTYRYEYIAVIEEKWEVNE